MCQTVYAKSKTELKCKKNCRNSTTSSLTITEGGQRAQGWPSSFPLLHFSPADEYWICSAICTSKTILSLHPKQGLQETRVLVLWVVSLH